MKTTGEVHPFVNEKAVVNSPKTDTAMVEVHDIKGTKSYGCFRNLKGAKPTLDTLRHKGELREENHAVTVCAFKNGILQRAYKVIFRDGWRIAG